jgi:hypothetical protein
MQNIGGTLDWLNNGSVGTMTLTNAGALAVSGGFTLTSGTLALPNGSVADPMFASNAVTSTTLATNALSAGKQLKYVTGTGTGTAVADCGTGFTPIFGFITAITLGPPNPKNIINCACTSVACSTCVVDPVARATAQFWLTKGKSSSAVTNMAACMAQ